MRTYYDANVETSQPQLSVVVAVLESWPAARECIERLNDQAQPVGAEIIVIDGTSGGSTTEAVRAYSNVVSQWAPGKSVFQLRAIGFAMARGDLLAVTEDHALIHDHWCERILEAHRSYPDATAIGGVVENGATDTLCDWANFLVVNAPFMAPLKTGPAKNIALQANVSYKRKDIPLVFDVDGLFHHTFHQELAKHGACLMSEPGVGVDHVQEGSFLQHAQGHFHNARSIAGFRLKRMSNLEHALRIFGCFVLPPVMFWRTLKTMAQKGRLHGAPLASLIYAPPMLCCHAAGEFVGYIFGLGDAPLGVK